MNIIINALSGNGDALMFSPALKLLKDKLPDASIDMLVMFRSVAELYRHHPSIRNIHFIDFLNQSKLRSLTQLRALKKNEYDYSINVYPSNRLEYNIVNAFLGAKTKISKHYIHSSIKSGEFLNDVLIDEVKNRHNVLQNVDLVGAITEVSDDMAGGMQIFISSEHELTAARWLNEINHDGKMLAGIHAGSALLKNHIHKRWSSDGFVKLIQHLQSERNCRVLLFGNEYELNEEIKEKSGGDAVIASTSDFMDSIARMKHCSLFVTNDTAFMHCAAALTIPVVAIFGYTNHKELYPWDTRHAVVRMDLECSPCFYNSPKPAECIFKDDKSFQCMKLISADMVIEAAERMLGKVNVSQ